LNDGKMKHAYLISAYKNPEQVHRLISTLDADNTFFFLHIDKKFDDKPFREKLIDLSDKIQYLKRERIEWGGFGIVKAAVTGFKAIDKAGGFDYLHFMTAQAYPIKPRNKTEDFFIENYGKSFINHYSLPRGWQYRINKYHIGKRRNQSKIHEKLLSYLNQFVGKTGIFKRKHPESLKPFNGEGGMSLHKSALQYILEYLKKNPRFLDFHKYSFAPDEMIFQTILLNHPEEKFRENLIDIVLYYVDWTRPGAKYYPITFGVEDFEELKNSDKLFARKFDLDYDSKILDLIDEKLLGKK